MTDELPAEGTVTGLAGHADDMLAGLVAEVVDYAILLLAVDGRVLTWNAGAERLKGYRADEIIGRHFSVFYPPEDVADGKPARALAAAAADGRVADEGWRTRQDGTRFWASVVITAVHGPDGALRGFGKVTRDLGDRRLAEQARARLAAIVDSSDDAIIGHSPGGVITSWNRAALHLYGYAPEDAIGRNLSMLTADDIPDTTGLAAGAEVRHHETVQVRRDGTRVEVALTISSVRDEHGRLLGMATIARDVSVQKRAERTFEGLLEFAPDAIVGVRADGRVTLANRQAEALFGYSRDELLDTPIERLVPGDAADGHVAHRAAYFADPRTRPMGAGVELHGRRKDGSEFLAEISLSHLETDEGVVAVAAVRDISDRAESERERELMEELNQARRLESVGQLAGGIAHDFNNLLGVIMNCAAFVADELPADSPALEDVEQIEQASRRAASLTRQLLIFSHRDPGSPEPTNLHELAVGLQGLLRRALGERVELEVVGADGLRMVDADRGQLEQVLVNLAINARDAMPHGGRLTIETTNATLDEAYAGAHIGLSPGDYVRLNVSDSGVGMSAEVAARAFDPFYTTKPKGEGTGLGLATVYGIVTKAGGHVMLYSEPGVGTSVKIHLPISAGDRRGPQARATLPATAPARGETVLVVEDEDAVRRVTERILTRAGYVVLSAGDGEEALGLAASTAFDVILSDVIMPRMTGPEMVARVREVAPLTRVIYMSGYSHQVLTHEMLEHEVTTAFIEKPFTADALLRKLRELLDGAAAG